MSQAAVNDAAKEILKLVNFLMEKHSLSMDVAYAATLFSAAAILVNSIGKKDAADILRALVERVERGDPGDPDMTRAHKIN